MRKKLQLLFTLLLALPIGMLAAGTEWTEATQLPLGQDQQGSLSKDRTEEWWQFTVTEDGAATFIVTPGSGLNINDVRLYYYNSDKSDYHQRTDNTYNMNPGWDSKSFTTPNLAPGTYLLKVQRNQGEGTYNIKVEFTANAYAKDKNPDDWNNANVLPLNKSVQGHLGYGYAASNEDYLDWWVFEVTEDGAATIAVTPGEGLNINDVRLHYYNSDKSDYNQRTDHVYNMNPGWDPKSFTTPNLAPGTYLLKVQRNRGCGGYTLSCTFTPSPYTNEGDVNNWQKPVTLPLNREMQGHLGYGYEASSEDNMDWWEFEVTKDGAATFAVTPGEGLEINDVRLHYYNSDKSDFGQRTDNVFYMNPGWDPKSFTTPNLAPGTYLLKVQRNQGCGGYSLKYTFQENTYTNENDANDWTHPVKMTLNKPVQGHLGYGYANSGEDNIDWWEFELTKDGAVTFAVTPEEGLDINDVRLHYYNSDKSDYHQRTDNTYNMNPGREAKSFTTPNLAPGTYLLKVQRNQGCGGYDLNCTLEPQAYKNDAEPNNEWWEGRDNNYLARGQEKQGHLGYGYGGSGDDNYDWYRIKVPRDGKVKLIYTPTTVNSHLRVNDIRLHYMNADQSDYHQRTDNVYNFNPGWDAGDMTIPNMAPGEYLVKVQRGEGWGAYSLKYEFIQNPLPNDGQPEDWQQATKLPEGKTLSGHLGYGYAASSEDNIDWYEVTMTKTGTLKINIQPGENLNINDVRLHTYNSDKSDYSQRSKGNFYINPGWDAGSLVTENVEPGDYLIKVQRGQGYGNYRIAFNADITDVEPLKPLEDEEVEPDPGPDPQSGGDVIDEFTLWYTLDIGGTVGYKLSEKPQVRLLGAETTVTSSRGVMTFETQKIWKFTLTAGDATPVRPLVLPASPEAQGSVSRSDDALVFSGCRPGEPVYVYTAGGRLYAQHRIGSDGGLELSLGSLRPGMYIVKAGSVNIKFLKK